MKLLDFGISGCSVVETQTLAPLQAGTPGYAAPERYRSPQGCCDPRSDIFSLGVTAYYLLTGHHPFRRRSIRETLSAVLHADPFPLAAQIPDAVDLAAVVMRCLAKVPAERYQQIAEVEIALRGCARAAESLAHGL